MNLKQKIKRANDALAKLNTYSDGVFAAGGRDATKKYLELNKKADDAIKALPEGVIRTRLALDLARLIR